MKKSIVFRGLVGNFFEKNLIECRKWFDGEIILSTWSDQKIDSSWDLDNVVLSKDPGPTLEFVNPSLKYSYRQIFSAQKGVEKTSGDLVLLTRTDMRHTKNIFNYYSEDKMLCSNMMTIDPKYPYWHLKDKCFRICDWFQLSDKNTIEKFSYILEDHSYFLNTGLCMEQIWNICFLNNKYNYKINPYRLEEYYNNYWKILLNHYNIKNTISTLGSINMNWSRQPERLECYLTEDKIANRSNL